MRTRPCFLKGPLLAAILAGTVNASTNYVTVANHFTFFLRSQGGYLPQTSFRSDEIVCYTLGAAGTNWLYHRRLPTEQAFDFQLRDAQGRQVPKTKLGREYSQPARPPRFWWTVYRLKPQSVRYEPRQLFRPDEMFQITNPGMYELQVRIRLFLPVTNGVVDAEALVNFRQFATNRHWGVVVSDPVCVNVIKN